MDNLPSGSTMSESGVLKTLETVMRAIESQQKTIEALKERQDTLQEVLSLALKAMNTLANIVDKLDGVEKREWVN